MMLPANITSSKENSVLSIAASSNKDLLIRFLNEQVEDGFYTLVIDYLKDSNFDLSNMMVDEDVKAQCTKLYELAGFVDENIKSTGIFFAPFYLCIQLPERNRDHQSDHK